MKIVIRAGGIGSRLWPMSRVDNPKQFQKIIGNKSMVRATYERVAPLLKAPTDLFMSVNKNFIHQARTQVPEIKTKNIITETDTRNTGPAVCLEVAYLEKLVSHNEVIASLPSDDYISDDRAFRSLLLTTEEFILNNPDYILTPAIKPDYPDTGYSYLKAGRNLQKSGEEIIYRVAKIVEKPSYDYCQDLLETGVYYCHTGMYLWQLKHIINLFAELQPTMLNICREVVNLMLKGGNFRKISELYSQIEKISIESAITEKVDKIAMSVSNKIGWSDLGKWHIVKRMLEPEVENNLTKGKVVVSEARNNLIFSTVKDKLIVALDVNDLAIIDTADALFVASLEKSAEVKKIVEELKEAGEQKYL